MMFGSTSSSGRPFDGPVPVQTVPLLQHHEAKSGSQRRNQCGNVGYCEAGQSRFVLEQGKRDRWIHFARGNQKRKNSDTTWNAVCYSLDGALAA
jgi:hypothetical protein